MQRSSGFFDRTEIGLCLRDADTVTADLLAKVTDSCRRFGSMAQRGQTAGFEALIAARAWTDAVLVLIELELPQWQVRRLVYDDGEWHCALSRQRELSEWLDQSVEAHHTDLALAVLSAFVDAQWAHAASSRAIGPAVSDREDPIYEPLCSDNFA